MALRVIEISELSVFREHRGPWQTLWAHDRTATIFQSFEWIEAYWKYFGENEQLQVLLVYDGAELIGGVPCTIQRERRRVGELRVLTFLNDGWGSFYGPIGGSPQRSLEAALEHGLRHSTQWDLIDWRWVPDVPSSIAAVTQAFESLQMPFQRHFYSEVALIDTRTPWDVYLSSRKRKFRENLRRSERRLYEKGDVRFLRYRPAGAAEGEGDPRWDLFEECVALAGRSWQGHSSNGTTLSHDAVFPFLREVHELAARCGMLDVNLLYCDDEPIAFAYNYHRSGVVQGLRVGYAPEYRRYGAGNLMWYYSIRDSFERQDQLIDLGPEYLSVKEPWLTRVLRTYAFRHYRLAARSQLLRLAHWLSHGHDGEPVMHH